LQKKKRDVSRSGSLCRKELENQVRTRKDEPKFKIRLLVGGVLVDATPENQSKHKKESGRGKMSRGRALPE